LRLALDCLPEASLLVDGAGNVLYANAAYYTLAGFPPAYLEGRRLEDFIERDRDCATGDRVLFRRKKSPLLSLRALIRPMAGANERRLQLVTLDGARPLSSTSREGSGVQIDASFLARVSHELRTPLTAMQEGIDVVLEGFAGPLNERQIEFLELARRNVRRLNRLVTDTFELDNLKRIGGLATKPVDLRRLVRESAALHPRTTCIPDGPPHWVDVDSARIRDALDRIIHNALQHGAESPVQIEILSREDQATVVVADSGPGIPPDELAYIFGEYEQVSAGPGRTVGGVSLGLAIARLIIERHGGRIWAESELGRGSRFCFSLKVCPSPVEEIS
jgi:signal transduction histidine kinase